MLMIVATELPIVGAMNKTSFDDVVIWNHLPDSTSNGMTIRCDRNEGIERTLATDFECIVTGPITQVTVYGSWKDDIIGTATLIHLSIHDDIPAAVSPTGYSMPGDLRWERNFSEFEVSVFAVGEPGWWWDPYLNSLKPLSTSTIWQYIINIPESQAFLQEGTSSDPVIYWLDVYVEAYGGEFGWRTTEDHRIDDAVYYLNDDPYWFELRYPPPHPREGDSIDLACGIIGKESHPPDIVVDVGSYDIFTIKPYLTNVGDSTYFNVTWTMSINGSWLWPISKTVNGTIASIQPNATVTIVSMFLFGFGPIEIIITINNQEPVIFKGFLVFFIIIYFP